MFRRGAGIEVVGGARRGKDVSHQETQHLIQHLCSKQGIPWLLPLLCNSDKQKARTNRKAKQQR